MYIYIYLWIYGVLSNCPRLQSIRYKSQGHYIVLIIFPFKGFRVLPELGHYRGLLIAIYILTLILTTIYITFYIQFPTYSWQNVAVHSFLHETWSLCD